MNERYETFTLLIAKISRSIRRLQNQEMADYGLRSAHITCLHYLYLHDGLTATDLCDRCEEDKATVSRALAQLEKDGYITCEVHGSKRYKAPLLLTEKGKAAGQRIADKIDRVLDDVSVGLTEDERIAFYRSLTIICDRLDDIVVRRS